MKFFVQIACVLVFGLLAYAGYTYWIQPNLTALVSQSSTPDCLYAAHVGAAGAGKVRFSPDGQFLAIASNSRKSILKADSGKLICNFAGSRERTAGICFAPDANQIAYGDRSTLHLKTVSGQGITKIDISAEGKLTTLDQIAFVPGADRVLITRGNGISGYDQSGKKAASYPTEATAKAVAVSPDGNSIFAAQWKGQIYKWASTDSSPVKTTQAHEKYLVTAVISPDGRYFVSLGRDHDDPGGDMDLKVWSTENLNLIHSYPIGKGVTDMSIDGTPQTDSSRHLLISKSTGEAIAFDLNAMEVKKVWQLGRGVSTCSISPDASKVCFGLSKHSAIVDTDTHRDFTTGRRRMSLKGKPIPYYTLKGQAVSPGVVLVLESKLEEQADDLEETT